MEANGVTHSTCLGVGLFYSVAAPTYIKQNRHLLEQVLGRT